MADKAAIHNLQSGFVVDRSVLVGMTGEEIRDIFSTARVNPNKRLVVIDNASTFFTAENLLKNIKSKNNDYMMIAEKAGVALSEEKIKALLLAEKVQEDIIALMKPKYVFAEVPAGWSFAADISFGPTQVRRKRPNGQGGGANNYYVSPGQLEKLWLIASKRWASGKAPAENPEVRAGDYKRRAVINETNIQLGCQIVQRYELEQVAKHKGWAFPG